MDCPSCGHPNRAEAQFCGQCGRALEQTVRCSGCGAEVPTDQRFCDSCGRELSASTRAPPSQAAAIALPRSHPPEHLAAKIRTGAAALEGERKQVTVLFVDVVGSMDLADQAGPDAWRKIMERLFSLCCEAVHRFEGSVDKFTGDGAMALFGAPIAHEDHGRRACYAALHLQRELASYAGELRRSDGLNLSVRMGLNSGEVVVGSIGEDLGLEYTAIGHTVGLAQRVEQLAEPGCIYLAQPAADLVEGYFALEELGEFEIKGVGGPVKVRELTGVGSARGRLDISRDRGFSRFVGRKEEMRILEDALERASQGQAQVIGLVGEAGVGKSRLCHEFAQRCQARGLAIYEAAALAHAQAVPLLPVLQLMRDYFDITEHDSDQSARERIAGKLLLLDETFADDLPLVFDFLSVPDPSRPSPRMDPDARQRRLFALIKRLTRAQSARQPGITIIEDLHWLDPASEAFLSNQIEAVQGTASLIVVNFRPQYQAAWMSKSYYRQIALAALGPEAIEELLTDLLGSDPSLGDLPEAIRDRTGGNPFFIEEVVQSLVEAGSLEGERGTYRLVREVVDAAVPASVQAVLGARIDRLSEREKRVLQTAAVIGREFSEPVLAEVAGLEQAELQDALRNLVAGEFVYEKELYPEVLYAFKHPLTQEVAHGSLLADRRAPLHGAVARALIDQHSERLDEMAALVAQHWDAAGESLEAARWNALAAGWTGTSDPKVSLGHWRRVRELAGSLPESEETTSLGLAARIFSLQYGWRLGTPREEAEATFEEAERMASRAGDIRSRAILLSVHGGTKAMNEGLVGEAAELARQAFSLAEEAEDPEVYMTVAPFAYALFLAGEIREATAVFDRALELAEGDTGLAAGVSMGCPYAHCLIFKGGYLIGLGEIKEAGRLIDAGIKLAGEHGDVEEIGWGHLWSCLHARFAGSPEQMARHAHQALEIAERIGDRFSRSRAWWFVSTSEVRRNRWQSAFEALERSREIGPERGTGLENEPARLGYLAEALQGIGDEGNALEAAAEGVETARRQGNVHGGLMAGMSQVRVLLRADRATAPERIESLLAGITERTREGGLRGYEAQAQQLRAELAARSGDESARQEELRKAQRFYSEIGAVALAEEMASELAMAGS